MSYDGECLVPGCCGVPLYIDAGGHPIMAWPDTPIHSLIDSCATLAALEAIEGQCTDEVASEHYEQQWGRLHKRENRV